MDTEQKIFGETRRNLILKWLKESQGPVTGGELSRRTKVSRQVIVQDISLLKARHEPILATSQGYLYVQQQQKQLYSRIVVCRHTPEQTERELTLLVDLGVTVKDVTIEHPVYGDLTASVMVSNRNEVKQFLKKLTTTNAPLLSELTDGIHMHTLEANEITKLDAACEALKEAEFLA
ncbi:transcription repressor NadR [Cytobacillus sp. Hm23]